eukprot:Skav207835  [mRNA]  locus=scaffold2005:19859:20290:- [translate_table: standard]
MTLDLNWAPPPKEVARFLAPTEKTRAKKPPLPKPPREHERRVKAKTNIPAAFLPALAAGSMRPPEPACPPRKSGNRVDEMEASAVPRASAAAPPMRTRSDLSKFGASPKPCAGRVVGWLAVSPPTVVFFVFLGGRLRKRQEAV